MSLPLSEDLSVLYGGEVFEASLCKLTCFFQSFGNSHVVFVAFKVHEMGARAHLKSFGYGKSEVSVKEKLNRLKGIVLGIQTSDSMRKDRRRVRCPICMHGEVTSLPWVSMFHDKKDLNEEGYC